MTIRQAIKGLAGVFRPGYPTGRNVYMVREDGQHETLCELMRRGIYPKPVCCGFDYNYRGRLYHLETTNKKGTGK